MIESYLIYALVGLMSGLMIMPIAYDLVETRKQNQTIKLLQLQQATRVHCMECKNYKHQNLMYSLDTCLDCYDIQIEEQWERNWEDKTLDIAEDING